jgi:hypothetical protein
MHPWCVCSLAGSVSPHGRKQGCYIIYWKNVTSYIYTHRWLSALSLMHMSVQITTPPPSLCLPRCAAEGHSILCLAHPSTLPHSHFVLHRSRTNRGGSEKCNCSIRGTLSMVALICPSTHTHIHTHKIDKQKHMHTHTTPLSFLHDCICPPQQTPYTL